MLRTKNHLGYRRLVLYDQGRVRDVDVHVLLLEAFVGPRPAKHETRHLNGIRDDNRFANLAWGTHRENQMDRVAHGTSNRGGGKRLTAGDVQAIRRSIETQKTLAARYGVSRANISTIRARKTWAYLPELAVRETMM
jgi:hypothetical protein